MRRVLVAMVVAAVAAGLALGAEGRREARWVVRDLGAISWSAETHPPLGFPNMQINDRGDVMADAFLWSAGTFTEVPGSGITGSPIGLNERGQLVGWFRTGKDAPMPLKAHGFFWQDGTLLDITPDSREAVALAVNDRSQVIGYTAIVDGNRKIKTGFLWHDGTLSLLDRLPGGSYTYPQAINERGQIAGYSDNRAVRWDNGKVTDLGVRRGAGWSRARDINDRGQVVGWSSGPRGPALDQTHAVLWTTAGKMIDLGLGQAIGVNARGQVIGVPTSSYQGFVWRSGHRTQLGFAPEEINDHGQIVGSTATFEQRPGCHAGVCHHAVVWENGRTARLPGLGGNESNALGINDNGQIVGTALPKSKPEERHLVLWTKTG